MKKTKIILGVSVLLLLLTVSSQTLINQSTYESKSLVDSNSITARKDETLKCIRWGWTGDVYERKVYCLEWVKKVCLQRLHKEICKQE